MNLTIGDLTLQNNVILGPMAGVTDLPFRLLCSEMGAGMVCMEMVSAKAISYHNKNTKALLEIHPGEHPASLQLFGSEPELIGEVCESIQDVPFDVLDFNMGCPVPKVVNNGEGSALMKNPQLAGQILKQMVDHSKKPVTVKIRKGWDSGSVNAVEVGKRFEQAGAAAGTVHGRTKVQMYAGKADWDVIRDVKAALHIAVTANGDVFEPEDAAHILRYTGCELAMVGRGAFGNPWIFSRGNQAINGEAVSPLPPLSERVDTALRQFELAAEQKGEKVACLEARRHFCWYLRGVAHAGYFKKQIVEVQTLEDIRRVAAGIKRELR